MTDILVVEDNLEMATLLCDFLEAEGYSAKHCADGERRKACHSRYYAAGA